MCAPQVTEYLGAGARQFGFMLRGLKALEPHFKELQIAFHLVKGNPADTIPKLVKDTKAGLLVVDQSPVRMARKWREEVCAASRGSCVLHAFLAAYCASWGWGERASGFSLCLCA